MLPKIFPFTDPTNILLIVQYLMQNRSSCLRRYSCYQIQVSELSHMTHKYYIVRINILQVGCACGYQKSVHNKLRKYPLVTTMKLVTYFLPNVQCS